MAEIVVVSDQQAAGELAAESMVDLIRRTPDAVLGLATGSTPLALYRALAERVSGSGASGPEESGPGLDVSRVRGFALDEYVGLPEGHPESYGPSSLGRSSSRWD